MMAWVCLLVDMVFLLSKELVGRTCGRTVTSTPIVLSLSPNCRTYIAFLSRFYSGHLQFIQPDTTLTRSRLKEIRFDSLTDETSLRNFISRCHWQESHLRYSLIALAGVHTRAFFYQAMANCLLEVCFLFDPNYLTSWGSNQQLSILLLPRVHPDQAKLLLSHLHGGPQSIHDRLMAVGKHRQGASPLGVTAPRRVPRQGEEPITLLLDRLDQHDRHFLTPPSNKSISRQPSGYMA